MSQRTHERVKYTEALVQEWGYVVMSSFFPHQLGEVISMVDLGPLPQPFAVVGQATREDFLAQRAFVDAISGATHPLAAHALPEYFYKIATD